MKISAKFNELTQTEILLHTTDPYSIGEIIKQHSDNIDKIEVKQARKSPCPTNRNPKEYEEYQALNQHKVFITFKTGYLPVQLKITSWRINADRVKTLGLEPLPKAMSKEISAMMMYKLGENDRM